MPKLGAIPSSTELGTVVDNANTAVTLALTDAGDFLRFTATTAITVTIPAQSAVAWLADTEIFMMQASTGKVSVVAGAGVALRTSQTSETSAQYAVIAIKRTGTDAWVCIGDRTPL